MVSKLVQGGWFLADNHINFCTKKQHNLLNSADKVVWCIPSIFFTVFQLNSPPVKLVKVKSKSSKVHRKFLFWTFNFNGCFPTLNSIDFSSLSICLEERLWRKRQNTLDTKKASPHLHFLSDFAHFLLHLSSLSAKRTHFLDKYISAKIFWSFFLFQSFSCDANLWCFGHRWRGSLNKW